MSILIGIGLIVLFYLLVYRTLIKSIPSDESKPVSDEEDRPYRYRYNYSYDTGRYRIQPSQKPKENLYTPFTDFPKNIHTSEEQLSRMRRSTDTWLYLFPSTFTGYSAKIFGNSREIYNTSFSACSCMDFQKRKLPCKHMYYLAFFSGRMNDFDWIGDDEYYIINRFKLSNRPVAKKIYSLPPEEVLILRHIVRSEFKGEPELYVDISKITNLLELGLLAKTGKKNKTRILLFSLKVVEIKRYMRSNGYIFKDMSRNGLLSSIVNSDFDYKNSKGYIVYTSVSLGDGIKGEEIERYLPEQWDGLKEGQEGYPFIPASSGWRNDILEEIVHGD
jgi:hypothetical protein